MGLLLAFTYILYLFYFYLYLYLFYSLSLFIRFNLFILFIHLFWFLLFIYLFIHLFIYLSIYLSTYSFFSHLFDLLILAFILPIYHFLCLLSQSILFILYPFCYFIMFLNCSSLRSSVINSLYWPFNHFFLKSFLALSFMVK